MHVHGISEPFSLISFFPLMTRLGQTKPAAKATLTWFGKITFLKAYLEKITFNVSYSPWKMLSNGVWSPFVALKIKPQLLKMLWKKELMSNCDFYYYTKNYKMAICAISQSKKSLLKYMNGQMGKCTNGWFIKFTILKYFEFDFSPTVLFFPNLTAFMYTDSHRHGRNLLVVYCKLKLHFVCLCAWPL